jgi:hypothetical protein
LRDILVHDPGSALAKLDHGPKHRLVLAFQFSLLPRATKFGTVVQRLQGVGSSEVFQRSPHEQSRPIAHPSEPWSWAKFK